MPLDFEVPCFPMDAVSMFSCSANENNAMGCMCLLICACTFRSFTLASSTLSRAPHHTQKYTYIPTCLPTYQPPIFIQRWPISGEQRHWEVPALAGLRPVPAGALQEDQRQPGAENGGFTIKNGNTRVTQRDQNIKLWKWKHMCSDVHSS